MPAVAKCWGCQEKILKHSSYKPPHSWGKCICGEEGGVEPDKIGQSWIVRHFQYKAENYSLR